MRFKINDLSIVLSDLAPAPVQVYPTQVLDTCPAASCLCSGTVRSPTRTALCDPRDLVDLDRYRESLGQLKVRLQQRLAEVEAQEAILDAGMRPRTIEEVEALERKLTGALSELQRMKANLR